MTKVLVFESDPSFAAELRAELGHLGCTVQVVDDGNVGLQAAAADRPDLILLSIELPRVSGFSVCNTLKKDQNLKDVPIVIMSSESSDETFEQHRKLYTRAEDYVHKPIAFGELLQHIRPFVPLDAGRAERALRRCSLIQVDAMTDRFHLLLQARRESTYDPPQLPPDMGPDEIDWPLWRFCHEENRDVLLQVGSEELESELEMDFLRMWKFLPRMVARLAAGHEGELSFSERGYDVDLTPAGDHVQCTVVYWGYENSKRSFLCDRAEVIGELRRFLDEIADLAVAEGYLSPAQRQELMSALPP